MAKLARGMGGMKGMLPPGMGGGGFPRF